MTRRTVLRRTTYLLIGGAVALGFVALSAAAASLVLTEEVLAVTVPLLAVVPMALVGLLPGLRELQVAGAETLLGVDRAIVPEPMSWQHRWRTCLWTFLHQVLGFLTGLASVLALSALVGASLLTVGSRSSILDGTLIRPESAGDWLALWATVLAGAAAAVGIVWLVGISATWAAPIMLGPVGSDRLAIAEKRLRREQEYRRLSRDLHDGVGHALSAISLQSEAAQRHLRTDPGRTAAALGAIAALAGSAVAELDHALNVLRDGATPRQPEPGLAKLDLLVGAHRDGGTDVIVEHQGVTGLPSVLSQTAYRICAEGLINAAKHGAGPVTLAVDRDGRHLRVRMCNPVRRRTRAGAGHGLDGLRERVDLLGGQLTAGPCTTGWVLQALLPLDGPRD